MFSILKKCIIAFLAGWVVLISANLPGQENFFKASPEDVFVQESLDKAGTSSLYKINNYQVEKRLSERHIFFNRSQGADWRLRHDVTFYISPELAKACLYAWNRGPPA